MRVQLPMAAEGCGLDAQALAEQLQRYRQLGACATNIDRRELGLTARFDDTVDVALLQETIAIERGCCSFLALEHNASERSLSISIDDPERTSVLELIGSALDRTLSPTEPH